MHCIMVCGSFKKDYCVKLIHFYLFLASNIRKIMYNCIEDNKYIIIIHYVPHCLLNMKQILALGTFLRYE